MCPLKMFPVLVSCFKQGTNPLLGPSLLDAELHASIHRKPPLAVHMTLVALTIDKGLIGLVRQVVDTGVEDLEDVVVADAVAKPR